MILRGVLDYSLGSMLCIRGFARMGNLAIVSKADESYQRDLIKEHKKEVLDFLHKKETLFFPEIILSYGIDESPYGVEKFRYNDDYLKISTRAHNYVNEQDARSVDNIQTATINIKRQQEAQIFNRIDGNHRLSAADEEKDDQEIQNLITPFCLLLLPKKFETNEGLTTEKLEKTIFHNINYKHIPLKKEHHYKMMIGDERIFTDTDLTNNFGKEYLYARQYLDAFNYDKFGSLGTALKGLC